MTEIEEIADVIIRIKSTNKKKNLLLPSTLKKRILKLTESCRIGPLAKKLGIPDSTIHCWKRKSRETATKKSIVEKSDTKRKTAPTLSESSIVPIGRFPAPSNTKDAGSNLHHEIELEGAQKKAIKIRFKSSDRLLVEQFFNSIVQTIQEVQ